MTTQEKEGFFYKPTLTYAVMKSQEKDTLSQDKSASPELLSLIKAAAKGLEAFGTLWQTIKDKGNAEGFTEQDLQDMLRPLLRDQLGMSKDRIYYLFHKEQKALANKQAYDKVRINREIVQKKDPEDLEDSSPAALPVEEEDREKALLRDEVDQLRDAIKKLQQFPKASELQQQAAPPHPNLAGPSMTKEDQDIDTVTFRLSLSSGKDYMKQQIATFGDYVARDLTQLKNRGWRWVKVTIEVVKQ